MGYTTKAEWATAKAQEARAAIDKLKIVNTMGRPSAAREKRGDMAFLQAESRRFEDMSRRYRLQGL